MTTPLLRDGARLIRHLGFAMALLVGLGLASLIYLVLALSECLPRDGSAEMQACDAIKRRDFWLFPVLVGLSAAGSILRHWRGAVGTWLVALTSGLIAAMMLMVINALLG